MLNLLFRSLRPPRFPATLVSLPFLFVVLVFRAQANDRAEDLNGAVRLLARRVAAVQQRERAVSLAWENRSSVSEPKSQAMKELFSEQLGGEARLNAGAENGAHALRVVIEDTPAKVLLIATVPTAHGDEVRMSEAPRMGNFFARTMKDGPRLQKELIWQQEQPILDAIEHSSADGNPGLFLILEPQQVSMYQGTKEHWELHDSVNIPGASAALRDPRGEIWFNPEEADVAKLVLPGRVCELKLAEKLALNCHPAEPSWRDGLFLANACDRTTLWLRSDSGDRSAPDHLLLGNPSAPKNDSPISEIDLPGPVLSLSSGEGFRSDTVVVRNLSTGNHEVYRISITCGE